MSRLLPSELWSMITSNLALRDLSNMARVDCFFWRLLQPMVDKNPGRWWPLSMATIYPERNVICRCPTILDLKLKTTVRDSSCHCEE